MSDDRLTQQMRFLMEMDKVKRILRRTLVMDGSRCENDAEHSWHMAVWAVVLAEYANAAVDVRRAVTMCLVHDVVEIDAGDAYCYDPAAQVGKAEREQRAAARIFGLLPADQAAELRGLWEEFEGGATAEAKLAGAIDRVQAVVQNFESEGKSWREHGVKASQVMARIAPAKAGSERLWAYAKGLVEEGVQRGWLREG